MFKRTDLLFTDRQISQFPMVVTTSFGPEFNRNSGICPPHGPTSHHIASHHLTSDTITSRNITSHHHFTQMLCHFAAYHFAGALNWQRVSRKKLGRSVVFRRHTSLCNFAGSGALTTSSLQFEMQSSGWSMKMNLIFSCDKNHPCHT